MPHIKGTIEYDCDFDALAEPMKRSGYFKVVRCRECKHSYTECDDLIAYLRCDLNHNPCQREDWFCADGERRKSQWRLN